MKKVVKIIKQCEACGKEMILVPYLYAKKYCSVSCRASMSRKEKNPNTQCAYCGNNIFVWPYRIANNKRVYCDTVCKGKWASANLTGENGANWRGGSWNNRVPLLAHTAYRKWRANILDGAVCALCGGTNKMELHHIESRSLVPERIQDESNVLPLCALCHDILHSKNSKGGELRERLNAILAHDNPQPSRSNVRIFVGRKVQRLMGEDSQSDKPDTSAAPERDEIVRSYAKA